ncbi:hypothetical protein K456DRAFT_1656562 [Colletotrichum gloeosporioides 23]|nr:hypothetical protein K456DRAFT_1656562 [Colletotrichum gloeosporioides 23]
MGLGNQKPQRARSRNPERESRQREKTYLPYSVNTAPTKTPQGLARAHDFKLPLSGRYPSPSCPQQTPPKPTASQPLAPNTASITSHQSPPIAGCLCSSASDLPCKPPLSFCLCLLLGGQHTTSSNIARPPKDENI